MNFVFGQISHSPVIEMLTSGTNTSLRGLSVVNDNILWVSGSNGTVGRSTNAGKNWKWFTVKGFEKKEFRDIEAFDAATAVIMAVGEPAYILKTNDGGDTWKVVYENKTRGMFLDAMEFWNEESGIVIGDPIDGRFFIARTFDGGTEWKEIPFENRPTADTGEACFAASGTCLRALDRDEAVFVSGGTKSRMFTRNSKIMLPIMQGTESAGANSISVYDDNKRKGGRRMIVVGGDFKMDSSSTKNCFLTSDHGKSWYAPKVPPHGYRSCVEYLSKEDILTCGLNGVDYSFDGGKTFNLISHEGYHVCRIAKYGPSIYLAGNNGRVGKVLWDH
ncbi:MAG TPA: YCF48-related protein [Chitinophagaceae bacterium]|nr:YCF48-related protein [Chitinophagaceae bacterium]